MVKTLRLLYEAGQRIAVAELMLLGIEPGDLQRAFAEIPQGLNVKLGTLDTHLGGIGLRIEREAATMDIGGYSQTAIARELDRLVPGARDAASRIISGAFDSGMGDILGRSGGLIDSWIYSAMMDANTCGVCESMDGAEFSSWEAITQVLPNGGPNPDCYGNGRCRCMAVPGGTSGSVEPAIPLISPSGGLAEIGVLGNDVDEAAQTIVSGLRETLTREGKEIDSKAMAGAEKHWSERLEGNLDATPERVARVTEAQTYNEKSALHNATRAKHGQDVVLLVKESPTDPLLASSESTGAHRLSRNGVTVVKPVAVKEITGTIAPGDFSTGVNGGTEAVLRHEYAHSIYEHLTPEEKIAFRDVLPADRNEWSKTITRYGATNDEEAFCEVYAIVSDPMFDASAWHGSIGDAYQWMVREIGGEPPVGVSVGVKGITKITDWDPTYLTEAKARLELQKQRRWGTPGSRRAVEALERVNRSESVAYIIRDSSGSLQGAAATRVIGEDILVEKLGATTASVEEKMLKRLAGDAIDDDAKLTIQATTADQEKTLRDLGFTPGPTHAGPGWVIDRDALYRLAGRERPIAKPEPVATPDPDRPFGHLKESTLRGNIWRTNTRLKELDREIAEATRGYDAGVVSADAVQALLDEQHSLYGRRDALKLELQRRKAGIPGTNEQPPTPGPERKGMAAVEHFRVIDTARSGVRKQTRVEADAAMKMLDTVFSRYGSRGTVLGRLEITSRSGNTFGSYMWGSKITLHGGALQNESTLATFWHEWGHFLDNLHFDFKTFGTYASEQTSAELSEWRLAVRESVAGRTVAKNAGGGGGHFIDRRHARYLADERELFARSFAQYVTRKVANAAVEHPELFTDAERGMILRAAQVMVRNASSPYARQWVERDFDRIEAAFDNLFGSLGWLA